MTQTKWGIAAQSVLILTATVILTGCNSFLVGSWKIDPVPKDANFFINTARFKEDDTYTAVAKKGEEDIMLAGGYDFNGFNLTLKSPGKKERVYPAIYILNGTLKLTVDDNQYTMKKQ